LYTVLGYDGNVLTRKTRASATISFSFKRLTVLNASLLSLAV
jgi:hypothetical protein